MSSPFDRSFAAAIAVLALVVMILMLLARDLGGDLPVLPRFMPSSTISAVGPRNNHLSRLFTPDMLQAAAPLTNRESPLTTTYFTPPPPPPPDPNIKKTRKVKLTYNGFFETNTGEKRAYVTIDEKMAMLPFGAPVISDLMISNIQRMQLTLRQAVTQEVVVPFRGSTEVEVPAE